MNKQEIFNTAATHLLNQGRKSELPPNHSCAYRGNGGTKCAIGALIPDEKYDPQFEGIGLGTIVLHLEVIRACCGIAYSPARLKLVEVLTESTGAVTTNDFTFLCDLQRIHDYDDSVDWLESLRDTADVYKLSTEVIDGR